MADNGGRGGSLFGAWTHAHEEDTEGRVIFRPSDFDLPPARGRNSLEFLPDGVVRHGTPGPDDRRQWGDGSWALQDDILTVRPEGQAEQRYQVEHVDDRRLVLRPIT